MAAANVNNDNPIASGGFMFLAAPVIIAGAVIWAVVWLLIVIAVFVESSIRAGGPKKAITNLIAVIDDPANQPKKNLTI